MRVTIKDIARMAGVSVQTVSNVINDRPVVGEATSLRVRAVLEQVDYTPNAAARALVTGRRRVVGVVVPHIGNPSYGEVTTHLTRFAGAAGYSVLVGDTAWSTESELRLLRSLVGQSVEGVILASTGIEGEGPTLLRSAGIPTVMLFNYPEPCDLDVFRADNLGAFRMVARHLIGLGHRRIGFVRGLARATSLARERGWRSEMEAHGLDVGDDLLAVSSFDQNGGHTAAMALLSGRDPPTAIMCSSDIMACGALDAAADLGLRVPHDIAITGFDDIFVAAMRRIRLTTVRYDRERMARQAFDRLLQLMALPRGAARPDPKTIAFPCDLVVRESCGMRSTASPRPIHPFTRPPSTSPIAQGSHRA